MPAEVLIADLDAETGAIAGTDLVVVEVTGVTKKVTVANFISLNSLALGPAATTLNSVPQWDAATRTLKDGLTLNTVVNDPGVDTQLVTEQGIREALNNVAVTRWKTVLDAYYTDTPTDTDTLAMSNTSDMAVGLPVRYTIGGTDYYGIVAAVVANTSIDIRGASLSGDVTALYVGTPEMVHQETLFIGSTYGDGAADLLSADNNSARKWGGKAAYLVSIHMLHGSVDSGANQPKCNVKVNAVAVSSEDGGNGVQLGAADTWVDGSAVAIDTAQYDLQYGEDLEVNCTVAGSNGDAEDLTVMLVFVLT